MVSVQLSDFFFSVAVVLLLQVAIKYFRRYKVISLPLKFILWLLKSMKPKPSRGRRRVQNVRLALPARNRRPPDRLQYR